MTSSYYSFLLCVHPGHADLYYTGIPLGQIRDGVFIPHQLNAAGGGKRELTIRDLPDPCPFQTMDQLREAITGFVSLLQFQSAATATDPLVSSAPQVATD